MKKILFAELQAYSYTPLCKSRWCRFMKFYISLLEDQYTLNYSLDTKDLANIPNPPPPLPLPSPQKIKFNIYANRVLYRIQCFQYEPFHDRKLRESTDN